MPPPYSIEGRAVTRNMRDYTVHMYSSKEKTSARGRQAKEYTPHPLWCVLPDQVSESTCKSRRQDTETMLRSGGGVPRGRSHRYRGKNTVLFYLSVSGGGVPRGRSQRYRGKNTVLFYLSVP